MKVEHCAILEKEKGNGADVNTARRLLSSSTKIEPGPRGVSNDYGVD
jgi:hypothetical protein